MSEEASPPHTPPPPEGGSKITSDTPREVRNATGGEGAVQARVRVAIEMEGEVTSCPVDKWFDSYQTFEPTSKDIDACIKALESPRPRVDSEGKEVVDPPLMKKGKFTAFAKRPSTMKAKEVKVYAPIKAIVDRIAGVNLDDAKAPVSPTPSSDSDLNANEGTSANATLPSADDHQRHATAQWSYDSDPNRALPGEQAGSTNQIDGFFHRKSSQSGAMTLGDVAILCEYKKKKRDAIMNRIQLIGGASHLLNQDPIRSAVYGITIEDDEVSLWYLSRSHTAKSESFSLMKVSEFLHVCQ
ncbi:hypothetical protein NMY22_g17526 [Coprinellus aureogranulatus]|nr:hypothetical protein NMY22_g17526 [Coprinellus aureogranulatus]